MDNTPSTEKELLAEADRLAAEVEADIAKGEFAEDKIGDMPELPDDFKLTPEMMEGMDPVLLQQLLAKVEAMKAIRKPQAFYTRKQTTKAQRKQKRGAQKTARAISSRAGNGKAISAEKRRKNAA